MRPIIELEGIAKRYRLGRIGATSIRDSIDRTWHRVHGKSSDGRLAKADFWALRDLSFAVNRGEMVGVIGQNGAGKSTLLKILSRITEPTRGEAVLRGRPASLLEVGTGFHPDLSGRENIFLNGAILGMRRHEIRAKFDEIVAFAEVEEFIDTPVKRYSSGMYVRLAFAVAAHLEPEILLVDEVLAVGDAAFQKKCLGKMGEVAREGRTILFVSHNMASILALCERVVLLKKGKLLGNGPTQEVVRDYLKSTIEEEIVDLEQRSDRKGDGSARLLSCKVESVDSGHFVSSSSRMKFTLAYKSDRPLRHVRFLVTIYDYNNTGIYLFDSDAVGGIPEKLPAEGVVTCATDPINLTPGRCYINLALFRGTAMADHVEQATSFDVEADEFYQTGRMPPREWVLCLLQHQWSLQEGPP
ncbi:MAG TPA: ABC transporter ATP-binding protein [Chthoniobacterales bacterium]|jgi:lipopolysaccharide transport system ATP-binding protein|nr:ABC transporter ATP-binding protein [Chthoniobacterales bacterium]